MTIDEVKSPALYFGTTTGQLWIGREGGESWECLFDSLPLLGLTFLVVVLGSIAMPELRARLEARLEESLGGRIAIAGPGAAP